MSNIKTVKTRGADRQYLVELDPDAIEWLAKPGGEAVFKVGGVIIKVRAEQQPCPTCGCKCKGGDRE